MKKYIIVALLALFALSSCKMENGTTPDKEKAAKLLFEKVQGATATMLHYSKIIAYSEQLAYGTERSQIILEGLCFEGLKTTVKEDKVIIEGTDLSLNNTYYHILTQGTKLYDGGLWLFSSGQEAGTTITFAGVAGESQAFTCNKEFVMYNTNNKLNLKTKYSISDSENIVVFSLSGSGEIVDKNKEYSIEFIIDENNPLRFMNNSVRTYTGTVDMVYKDLVLGTVRRESFTIN